MPDSNLDDYMLSHHQEPYKWGPPLDRAAPTFNDIVKKEKHVETQSAISFAGNITFPMLLDLLKSEDSKVACKEEEEAYSIWCCEVNMYCQGKDLYNDWSSSCIPKLNPMLSPKSHPKPTAKATNPQQQSSHSKPTSAGSNGGQGSKNPEAITVDGECGNMYPGITCSSGLSQSVQSYRAQS
ncbi:hypothetical protein FRC11_015109, partial [Ceratobasidium sp. 423]